jgi:uncharacterized membrane protein YozB (DUF420 family)
MRLGCVMQDAPTTFLGLPLIEVAVLFVPVVLYTIFTVWRTSINPNLKISDFLFAVWGFVLLGNIVSILVFKVRYF